MKKSLKIQVLLSIVIILFSFNFDVRTTKAAYSDNENGLYHKLSQIVYKAKGDPDADKTLMQNELNKAGFLASKYKVLDVIDIDSQSNHPMGKNSYGVKQKLDATGFKAMAVSVEKSKKVFLVFAGSQNENNLNDAKTALLSTSNTTTGQNIQAQLYINYIYKTYSEKYAGYNWYLTGHSLGGWLSTKLYLDIRSANWLTSAKNFKYGGAIKPSISGVYTFNPLPISKNSISLVQWNANLNGAYNKDVKNLYIENEWLNSTQKVHSKKLAYIGTKGAVNTGLWNPLLIDYISFSVTATLADFYTAPFLKDAHRLCSLNKSVAPINKTLCSK